MDLVHHICRLTLDGRLYLSPIQTSGRVLDLGTGTGIWAIDFAEYLDLSTAISERTMLLTSLVLGSIRLPKY